MSPVAATGRAGRLRLRRRLDVANRASELLDRKQRILTGQLDRMELESRRTGDEWRDAAAEAATWLQRSAALDGQRGLTAAAPVAAASVAVEYAEAMGVRYPVHATARPPDEPGRSGSSALGFAVAGHRRALAAAVRHAATLRAHALLTAELEHTRARQRAIENRWIPRLEDELHTLEAQLDEMDREENVRVRWAAERLGAGRGGPG
ncbi:MAG: V-type ATP synthase subunit D [Actinomycetota bacterium]